MLKNYYIPDGTKENIILIGNLKIIEKMSDTDIADAYGCTGIMHWPSQVHPLPSQGFLIIAAHHPIGHDGKKLPGAVIGIYEARLRLTKGRQDDEIFYIHEDADSTDEFGCDSADEALRAWLMYGATTDEFDCDHDGSVCLSDLMNCEHTIYQARWVTVRDADHLARIQEMADPTDDAWMTDTLEVGCRFWESIKAIKIAATVEIKVRAVSPNA